MRPPARLSQLLLSVALVGMSLTATGAFAVAGLVIGAAGLLYVALTWRHPSRSPRAPEPEDET